MGEFLDSVWGVAACAACLGIAMLGGDGDAPSPPTITPRPQQAVWINAPEDKTKSEIRFH